MIIHQAINYVGLFILLLNFLLTVRFEKINVRINIAFCKASILVVGQLILISSSGTYRY